jgi:50S ribosomal protein L16 3-hydroxylase
LIFPNDLSPESFLSGYWQKQPLYLPGALDAIRPTLTSGELAWLATQDDVESRLVFSRTDGDRTHYQVKHGPFENDALSSLPRQNWTLLVQDVEKHLPDFRNLFAAVDFVPDWRIDDLMVSFAAPGGSVGPHKDNYDVFLCQGEGSREWHLGDPDLDAVEESGGDLQLVRPFTDTNPATANTGDVLYLPPGVPHWGIARDFCMTYSIGMRAPTSAEFNAGIARLFDAPGDIAARSSATGSDIFYGDPDLTVPEAAPGLVSDAAIRRARKLLPENVSLDDLQVATALGSVVTDPKAWLEPESTEKTEIASTISRIRQPGSLSVHGMSKLAYCNTAAGAVVFANGHAMNLASHEVPIVSDICNFRTTDGATLCAIVRPELLEWLLTSGVFDLTERTA